MRYPTSSGGRNIITGGGGFIMRSDPISGCISIHRYPTVSGNRYPTNRRINTPGVIATAAFLTLMFVKLAPALAFIM